MAARPHAGQQGGFGGIVVTVKDALEKLPEYVEGGLTSSERTELEQLISCTPELAEARDNLLLINRMLCEQDWLAPSVSFTSSVLTRARGELKPARREVVLVDVFAGLAPYLALILTFLFYGHTVWGWMNGLILRVAGWLDHITGLGIFEAYPVILLGVLLPVAAALGIWVWGNHEALTSS